MRVLLHAMNRVNRYVAGQNGIELLQVKFRVKLSVNICMKKLLSTMHPCIGATATYYVNRMAKNLCHALFHYLLHTHRIFLVLPAVVVGAVVGDFEEVAQV